MARRPQYPWMVPPPDPEVEARAAELAGQWGAMPQANPAAEAQAQSWGFPGHLPEQAKLAGPYSSMEPEGEAVSRPPVTPEISGLQTPLAPPEGTVMTGDKVVNPAPDVVSGVAMGAQPTHRVIPGSPGRMGKAGYTVQKKSGIDVPDEVMELRRDAHQTFGGSAYDAYKAAVDSAKIKRAEELGVAQAEQDAAAERAAVMRRQENEAWAIRNKYENMEIDPRRVWNNMNAFQQITATIGMALGGMLHASTGSNPFIDMMNTVIDRDIAAQRANRDAVKDSFSMMGVEHEKEIGSIEEEKIKRLTAVKQELIGMEEQLGPQESAARSNLQGILAQVDTQLSDQILEIAKLESEEAMLSENYKIMGGTPARRVPIMSSAVSLLADIRDKVQKNPNIEPKDRESAITKTFASFMGMPENEALALQHRAEAVYNYGMSAGLSQDPQRIAESRAMGAPTNLREAGLVMIEGGFVVNPRAATGGSTRDPSVQEELLSRSVPLELVGGNSNHVLVIPAANAIALRDVAGKLQAIDEAKRATERILAEGTGGGTLALTDKRDAAIVDIAILEAAWKKMYGESATFPIGSPDRIYTPGGNVRVRRIAELLEEKGRRELQMQHGQVYEVTTGADRQGHPYTEMRNLGPNQRIISAPVPARDDGKESPPAKTSPTSGGTTSPPSGTHHYRRSR